MHSDWLFFTHTSTPSNYISRHFRCHLFQLVISECHWRPLKSLCLPLCDWLYSFSFAHEMVRTTKTEISFNHTRLARLIQRRCWFPGSINHSNEIDYSQLELIPDSFDWQRSPEGGKCFVPSLHIQGFLLLFTSTPQQNAQALNKFSTLHNLRFATFVCG